MLGEEACSTDGSIPGFNAPAGKRWAISTKPYHDNTVKETTELSRSNVFMDAGGDGLLHRTAWEGARRGFLIFYANGDDRPMTGDAALGQFGLLVTNADGSTTTKTLAQLNITEINLTADATTIVLPDGSVITGQTTFKRSDNSTGKVADTKLVSEVDGNWSWAEGKIIQLLARNTGQRSVK